MPPGLFPAQDDNALRINRTDVNNPLGTFSKHSFTLDGLEWSSVEHYFQAKKFDDVKVQEKIRQAPHPEKARRLGRSRFRKIRKDWKTIKTTIMTRAVYTKCRAHPAIAEQLLATGDTPLVENSQYDYYWGSGRDNRGDNHYGVVLMNVREKLRQELAEQTSGRHADS